MPGLLTETIGFLGGCCTTAAFLPQVLHTWRTRSARDLSLSMYLLFVAGVALWTVYGLCIGSIPVILFNLLTLVLALAVVAMKLRFGREEGTRTRTHPPGDPPCGG